jgi:uncharacterized protein with HEPN domain
MSYDEFLENQDAQDVVIRSSEIVGEATTPLSGKCRDEHLDIPWREMKQFRNVLIHQYFRLDTRQVWSVSRNDIPEIVEQIQKILA